MSKHHKELINIDKKQLSVVPSIEIKIIDQEFNNTDITSSKAIHLNVRTSIMYIIIINNIRS